MDQTDGSNYCKLLGAFKNFIALRTAVIELNKTPFSKESANLLVLARYEAEAAKEILEKYTCHDLADFLEWFYEKVLGEWAVKDLEYAFETFCPRYQEAGEISEDLESPSGISEEKKRLIRDFLRKAGL